MAYEATVVGGPCPADIRARCDALQKRYMTRDTEVSLVRSIRRGDFEAVAPGAFTDEYPAPIVANRIDTMARDMAATLTMLPTFSCLPSSTLKDRAKRFADKRTRIAQHYVESSLLQAQMPDASDSYHASGFFAGEVRPDLVAKTPKIKLVDGAACYPVWDQDFNTTEILVVTMMNELLVKAHYPEVYRTVKEKYVGACVQGEMKVYRHQDKDWTTVYLPDAGGIVLERVKNPLGKCTYVAIPRPMGQDWFTIPRGAFADLVYPMIAANEFRMLALESTYKSVQAPTIVPTDVTDVPFGPDATIHTNNPQGVGRLKIEVPTSAFQASELLDQDMQIGAMSPGSRSGSINASVITGRGVDALGEGYSQQVALAQMRIGIGLKKLVELCFEMDEKYWPNDEKEIRGQSLDNPGTVTYVPAKDIKGDWTVNVDYGFLLGLDANRALVFILQAQGAGLISNDTAARNLPIKLNLAEEQNRIQLEQLRTALLSSIAASSQVIPQMLANGQQPTDLLAQIAAVVEGVKKGKDIETVVSEVFAPPEPEAAPAAPAPQDPMAALAAVGGGAAPPEGAVDPATGAPSPDARVPLQQIMAGLTGSGSPNLRANVSRQIPVAGAS